MATGFSDNERKVSRYVAKALEMGVPESALGMVGTRTVGPMATLQVGSCGLGYYVNYTHGIFLGKNVSQCVATLRAIVREHTQHADATT